MNIEDLQVELDHIVASVQEKVARAKEAQDKVQLQPTLESAQEAMESAKEAMDAAKGAIGDVGGMLKRYAGF